MDIDIDIGIYFVFGLANDKCYKHKRVYYAEVE